MSGWAEHERAGKHLTPMNSCHNPDQRASDSGGPRSLRRDQRGFGLLVIAVCATVMFGMLGLAFDLGRMFIVKNELQTFVDASAIAACRQMDGTQTGIQISHTTATAGPLGATKPNGWDFDVNTISNNTETYATSFAGPYDSYATAASPSTNNYRFINVTANATLPLYFMAVIPGLPTQQLLQATATAGQQAQSSISNGGLEPFMPDAHNAADTHNFGFIPNTEYTLKWGNGSTNCAGDLGFNDPNSSSNHGFVDLGQGGGNSSLRGVIVYGGYPNANSTPSSVYAGMALGADPGNRGSSIFASLQERSNQDPDQTSTTWEQYKAAGIGNGRRIITVPIGNPNTFSGNGSNTTENVVGFANFFLDLATTYSGTSGPICSTYIGPGSLNGYSSGGSDGTKFYSSMLYR